MKYSSYSCIPKENKETHTLNLKRKTEMYKETRILLNTDKKGSKLHFFLRVYIANSEEDLRRMYTSNFLVKGEGVRSCPIPHLPTKEIPAYSFAWVLTLRRSDLRGMKWLFCPPFCSLSYAMSLRFGKFLLRSSPFAFDRP